MPHDLQPERFNDMGDAVATLRQVARGLMRIKVSDSDSCDDLTMVLTGNLMKAKATDARTGVRLTSLLPREHGSWALALEPMLLAVLAAPSWRGAALAGAAVALFLMRRPWQMITVGRDPDHARLAKRALAGLALVATVLGAGAIQAAPSQVSWALTVAVAAASIFAWYDSRRGARAALAECAGAATFAALAVAIVQVSPVGTNTTEALAVGAFALARSWTSILPVRVYVRRRKGLPESGVGACVVASAAVVGAVVMAIRASSFGWVPVAWVVVFLIRAVWLVGPWAPDWPARRIGWLEAALGFASCVSAGISFR